MKKYLQLLSVVACLAFVLSCQKTINQPKSLTPQEVPGWANKPPVTSTICGTAFDTTVINYFEQVVGKVTISNDATNYYFTIINNPSPYKISQVKWIYGTEVHVKSLLLGLFNCGTQVPAVADSVTNYSPERDTVKLTVPISKLGSCFFFHAHIRVVKRDPFSGQIVDAVWVWTNGTKNASQNSCQRYFQYCARQCKVNRGHDDEDDHHHKDPKHHEGDDDNNNNNDNHDHNNDNHDNNNGNR